MTAPDAAARAPARLEQVTVVVAGVALAATLAAIAVAVLDVAALMAVPSAVAAAICVVRDARDEARLRFDALALACATGALAIAAAALGDDAASILCYVIVGAALGLVAGRAWAVYLAVLLSLGYGLYGLVVAIIFVPSVIAGVVSRPPGGGYQRKS